MYNIYYDIYISLERGRRRGVCGRRTLTKEHRYVTRDRKVRGNRSRGGEECD